MKKVLLALFVLMLTGCKSELVCTINTVEQNYESEIKTVFEFNGDTIKNAYSVNTMTFETEKEMESYLNMLDVLGDDFIIIKKNNKQIEMKASKEFDIYKNDKKLIIDELEKEGYICE